MKRPLKLLSVLLALLMLTGCAPAAPDATGVTDPIQPPDTALTIHFLDVGQADCALLSCGGEYVLIDGGNRSDSDLVVSYLEQQGVQELEAVFCSHAHEDHVGGLPGVLAVYPTQAVYAPTRTYSSEVFDDFLYYTDQQGLEVTIPQPGDQIFFGDATISVLGPLKSYAETNDTSLVLMVDYGADRILFTGDMEITAENDLLEAGTDLKADLLKVGHHGSDTSTGYRFLYQVDPAWAVISVGTGNAYGHPAESVLSRLTDAGTAVYRTDELGTIIATSYGEGLTITYEKGQGPAQDLPGEQTYIGNKNSHVFHSPECANLPGEDNRVYFQSYQEAADAGYSPCGNCLGD